MSKCDQIRSFLRIWSHLLKKSLTENFIFCAVFGNYVWNFYYGQLTKIIICVKYSIDTYYRYNLPRYILPFHFGNLDSCDFHGDSLNVVFPRFPYCFLPFPLVFPHISSGVSTVFSGISPISPVPKTTARNYWN